MTLNIGNIKIRDVTTKNEYGRIKINWNSVDPHKNNDIESDPVTCVIRYKVKYFESRAY